MKYIVVVEDSSLERIFLKVSDDVSSYMNKILDIKSDIRVLGSYSDEYIILEDNIGGRTISSDLVVITVKNLDNLEEDKLFEVLTHETAHAMRWKVNPEFADNLFKWLIMEGIATNFEYKAVIDNELDNPQYFLSAIISKSDEEIDSMLSRLSNNLDDTSFNADEIFFGGRETPRWLGYIVGHYLVKKYLELTGKDICEAYADTYDAFRKILTENRILSNKVK